MRQQSASAKAASPAPASLPAAGGRILRRKCACGKNTAGGSECGACGRNRNQVLRRAAADGAHVGVEVPPVVHETLGSRGRPLDAPTRSLMESRFGHDFSGVRIHTDARAAESASAVNALAYTVGRDVVFGAGQYAPDAASGRRLLAHELTHVVQQSRGAGTAAEVSYEREADAAAHAFERGGRMSAVTPTGGPLLQRFASREHRSLGNEASGNMTVNVGGTSADETFELEFGDVVMLSADYFSPDDLRRLAALPGKNGTRVNSRDEIIYALYLIQLNPNASPDTRFKAGGVWANYNFSPAVKAAVNSRYQKLAAANTPHFAAPRGRDASGQPIAGPASESNAGDSYQSVHESALRIAYAAGLNKGDTSQAMAREAAAQHFLSDAFSAGHVRTPIGQIREYWSNLYPLFWYNLRHKIALDTAVRINSAETNLTTIVGTVQMIYEGISGQVEAMATSLPEVTLGDLIALVFHDFDNKMGLEIGGGQKVFGDSNLDNPDPNNVTRSIAVASMRAGIKDVKEAFDIGATGTLTNDDGLYNAVRTASGAPAGTYVARTMLPQPDASAPRQNWKAPTFESLWGKPVVGKSGPTVGGMISASLQLPGGDMREQLEGLAEKFPEVNRGVHPRRAYLEGFVKPLIASPFAGILSIINWAPNYGLRGVDRDDISLATGEELRGQKKLAGMTTTARVSYIRELISGAVYGDEEELVVNIFETAPPAERPRIYELVEGHRWKGDWVRGIRVADDEIWNALRRSRLDRLRKIINQGWSGTP